MQTPGRRCRLRALFLNSALSAIPPITTGRKKKIGAGRGW
jgi:hypothetical protein